MCRGYGDRELTTTGGLMTLRIHVCDRHNVQRDRTQRLHIRSYQPVAHDLARRVEHRVFIADAEAHIDATTAPRPSKCAAAPVRDVAAEVLAQTANIEDLTI